MDTITNISKGYAFCEFHSDEDTDKAIKSLNGLMVQGKAMQVKRANTVPVLN